MHDGYAAETVINGNVSHCIEYLRDLRECGIVGEMVAHDELVNLKQTCPDKYNYIKEKVFILNY